MGGKKITPLIYPRPPLPKKKGGGNQRSNSAYTGNLVGNLLNVDSCTLSVL